MNASTAMNGDGSRRTSLRRWWFWLLLFLCLLAGAWLGLKYSSTGKRAEVAAGYMAHVACSCRYVGNRDMPSCDTDREPGMDIVKVVDDTAKRSVTASVPLLARRTATFDPEYGCTLDKP